MVVRRRVKHHRLVPLVRLPGDGVVAHQVSGTRPGVAGQAHHRGHAGTPGEEEAVRAGCIRVRDDLLPSGAAPGERCRALRVQLGYCGLGPGAERLIRLARVEPQPRGPGAGTRPPAGIHKTAGRPGRPAVRGPRRLQDGSAPNLLTIPVTSVATAVSDPGA